MESEEKIWGASRTQFAAGASSPEPRANPCLLHEWEATASPESPEAPCRDGAEVPPVHQHSLHSGGSGPPHPTAGPWE